MKYKKEIEKELRDKNKIISKQRDYIQKLQKREIKLINLLEDLENFKQKINKVIEESNYLI